MEMQKQISEDATAQLKLRINQQRQLAATLARNGMAAKASAARATLLNLLNSSISWRRLGRDVSL